MSDAISPAGEDNIPPIAGIGASAGGLEALREVFNAHQGSTGMAFVVVQHLDPDHESLMAQLLERYTDMAVTQAAGGETIEADHIYVIPPGHGLAVKDGVLELTEFRDPRGLRRPIDDFFESLAQDRGRHAACVILSGTGRDGSRGMRAIKEFGGLSVVQEPNSARYDGMPVSAINTGLVDMVVRPGQVIECLRNFFRRADSVVLSEDENAGIDHFDTICLILQEETGHDFSGYKRSTLSRRVSRRMQVIGAETARDYVSRLREDPTECDTLFRDLLINVTRFFRDPEEFERLVTEVIDPLVQDTPETEEMRVWVAGCSSGEEAYSIALLFAESQRRLNRRPYLQIFATDIDDKMLEIARSGIYPLSALGDIPVELHEYLDINPDHFRIGSRIRDLVRFSSHNIVRDPPFSRIDLVTCRNLLIYFDEELQRQVLPTLHFALDDNGKLFLGSSETIGRFEDLFESTNPRSRIYNRRQVPNRYALRVNTGGPLTPRRRLSPPPKPERQQRSAQVDALEMIAKRYAPVSLLVDAEGSLIDRWGATGRYLDFPDRFESDINVARQAKPGLREIIGPLLREVATNRTRKIARNVEVETDFGVQPVNVMCESLERGSYLLLIQEVGGLAARDLGEFEEYERGEGEIRYLQDELQAARHRLRSTVEELETANEELKSSNEEMMSMNEELQSTNEELTTVNDELKAKVDQLTVANSDVRNFFESTQLAIIVIDRKLAVRSYTDAASEIFEIEGHHVGMALPAISHALADDEYLTKARKAAMDGVASEFRVQTDDGTRQLMARTLPYRRADGTVDGATLVFTDITDMLKLETALGAERARLRMALEVAKIGVWEYEPSTGKTTLDHTERALLGIDSISESEQMEPILARLPAEDRDRVNQSLRQAMDGEVDFDENFRIPNRDGSYRWMHGLGRRLEFGEDRKFIGVTYDITAQREQLEQRELMIREMNHRVKNLFAVISALVAMSSRSATDVATFAHEVRDRIEALGRAHSLATDHGSEGLPLEGILRTIVRSASNGQDISFEGEEVTIPSRHVTPLALILHEWTTNAAKYGALSRRDGSLKVSWHAEDHKLVIDWQESGKSGEAGEGTGFGTQLVAATTRQIDGTAEAEAIEGGYRRRLSFNI